MMGAMDYQKIEKVREVLRGKKTYFTVAIGVLYVAGVWLGFWEWNETVLAVLGLSGIAFLRSAIKRGLPLPTVMLCAVLISGPGCATTNQDGRMLASVAVSVESAMEGWGEWVKAGQATAQDEARVKEAYEDYQAAMRAAKKAYVLAHDTGEKSGWATAARVLKGTQKELLALVERLSNKS
jgi:hypothetical protein